MQWYHSDGSDKFGPVDDARFSELIRAGTVDEHTLVWREGMTGWDRLGNVDPSRLRPIAIPPLIEVNPNACAECGIAFPPDELVTVSGHSVCAACKPAMLQRLREGAPLSPLGGSLGMFRQGDRLVVEAGATPPNRCIHCNAPGTWRKRRTFHWFPPWMFALLILAILGLLIVAILSVIFRKTLAFDVVLCTRHAARRRRNMAIGWGLFGLGIASMIAVGFNVPLRLGMLAGTVLTVAAFLVGMRAATIVTPVRIGKLSGCFSRAGKEFVETLPQWPGDIV